MNQATKIAVIGGGSWATANVKMLLDNTSEKEVFWWMRNEDSIEHIRNFKHNPNYLSSVEIRLPEENISKDIVQVITNADMVLLNVPAAFLKDALADVLPEHFAGKK
jgi:glycerol-3-phosphate dehydrogenase (NAD(P)+)